MYKVSKKIRRKMRNQGSYSLSKRNRSSPPDQQNTKPKSKVLKAGSVFDVFTKQNQTSIQDWTGKVGTLFNMRTKNIGIGRGKKKLVGSLRMKSGSGQGRRFIMPMKRNVSRQLTHEFKNLVDRDKDENNYEEGIQQIKEEGNEV